MASDSFNNHRERTHTHDGIIIQDYGQYVHSATAKLALPTHKGEETEADRLQVTHDLFHAVNWAKCSGNLLFNAISVDFSAMGGSYLARGGFFQTRHIPGQRVAKYPLVTGGAKLLPRSTYESILKELRILCHAPLRDHSNVVQLAAIQWSRVDPVADSWIPVLLLEEAHHGSLQQYVESEKPGIQTCLQLSREIGSGLQALHASGVIHGDLKFQNVLVFDLGDGLVRAKLSDFGSAVIKGKDHRTVTLIMGTHPWTSPEHGKPVHSSLLCGTDTYSYGLLVWKLCLQGQSPFDGQTGEEIRQRKTSDLILGEAVMSLEEHYQRAMLLGGQAASCTRFQSYKLAVSIPRRCLEHCLSASLESRDLDKAVESLHNGTSKFSDNLHAAKKRNAGEIQALFAKSRMIVGHLRLFDTPRSVKAMLHRCMTDITKLPDAVDRLTGMEAAFQLSLQTFDGFGPVENSMASAVALMRTAAMVGSPFAQVMLGRFYEASGVVVTAAMRSECETLLVRGVEKGSLLARIWLRRYNRGALEKAEQKQAQEVAGVSLGKDDAMFDHKDIIDGMFDPESIASLSSRLPERSGIKVFWLSERKNSHLHAGAAFGVDPDRFRSVLDMLRRVINNKDAEGNTPLLLAVRFNHVDIAKMLLENGADASLPNSRGETPWHWLVAIEMLEDIADLVKLFKQSGSAALNATSDWKSRHFSVDIFGVSHGGTALHWAVELGMVGLARTLVSCGADIQRAFRGVRPVDIAIRRNKPEILRMFLDVLQRRGVVLARPVLPSELRQALKESPVGTAFENYVSQAIAFHPFHERLAYGGRGWVDALRHTLLVLREFDMAPKIPISALPQLLMSTGNSTAILKILSEEDFLERGSNQAKFWGDVAQEIITTADTTNVFYAMKRAKAYSDDGRIPNAEKLLDRCTWSFGCDGTVVDALASEGIKMDFHTEQSRTPLMGAVLNRNFEIASTLIRHGADVNAMWKPIYPNSPDEEHPDVNILFEYLTTNQDTALVVLRYLLEPLHSRKDLVPSFIVVPSSKTTALHLACRYGNPTVVDYLLEKFGTPYHLDFRDNGGFTPLHFAVFHGHADIATKLCERGARVDILAGDESLEPKDRRNALDYCYRLFSPDTNNLRGSYGIVRDLQDVYLGRLKISEMLVRMRHAARTVGSEDDDDMVWSAKLCFYAAQNNMSRLLKEVLEVLRNDSASEMPWQDALDRLLVDAALLRQAGSAKLLVQYGANVNHVLQEHEQTTLLHQVIMNRDADIAYLLLRAGATVNAYDKAGETPLSYALRANDLATCRVLKHFGGMLTMPRDSMARFLVKELGRDVESVAACLQEENIHLNVKLGGEPSDDDTEDNGDADEGKEKETDED